MMVDTNEQSSEAEEDIQLKNEMTKNIPEISFHAITGAKHPHTLRVIRKLRNKEIMVLVDGRSTHNFIDQSIVTKFGLPVVRHTQLQVMIANREKIDCMGMC